MRFFFDDTGDVVRLTGERYYEEHGTCTLRPWIVTCGDHDTHNGVRLPTDCEVAWQLPSGLLPYCRCHVTHVEYQFSH